MRENILQKTLIVCIGAFFCCLLWGSAFPCIKIGYNLFHITSDATGSQILFGGIRFCLAGLLAILFGSLLQRKLLLPKKSSLSLILKLSSFQTIGQYILFYIGLAHTSGVRASIVEGTNVFVALLVACFIFHQEKLTVPKTLGSLIGFSGVVLISLLDNSTVGGPTYMGDLFVFFSTVCYALSSVLLKRYSTKEDTVILSGYQFLIGGIVMTIIGCMMGGGLGPLEPHALPMLFYLAFISAAAYTVWGILLKYNPVSKVAVFGFMNPALGVILSALFLQENSAIGLVSLVSLSLICIGIYFVNR